MLLWTYHTLNFSLIEGHVDHSKSEYYQTVCGVKEAYAKLHEKMDTDQLIWCCLERDLDFKTKVDCELEADCELKGEWELEVPEKSILALIDDIVWNKILGRKCSFSRKIRQRWFEEACQKGPPDANKRAEIVEKKEADIWDSLQLEEEQLWGKLILSTPSEAIDSASALVPHRVCKEWVIKSPL